MEHTIVVGTGKCPRLPWMVEFHATADGKVFNDQLTAAFAPNFLEHQSALQANSKTRRKRLTQFAVVIPPKVRPEEVEDLLKAGMTVAVVRFDYFTVEEVLETVKTIEKASEEFGKKIGRVFSLAIALDISEPTILTGTLEKPHEQIELRKGQTTKVLADPMFKDRVSPEHIYVNYQDIAKVVKPGDSLILGDSVHVSALEVARDIVECIVERAGLLAHNVCVTLPDVPIILPPSESRKKLQEVTDKFQTNLVLVGPGDVEMARQIVSPCTLVFAKIEHACTPRDFDHILAEVDGILIDGQKLLATTKENTCIVQKSVVANCNKAGKPVVAVISCNIIDKAHASDVANTVLDGIDALLLPPDTGLIESVGLVCKAAEGALYQKQIFADLSSLLVPPIEPITSVAIAAVHASLNSHAAAIILMTTSGRTAKLVARYRPRCPIIALTRFARTAKQLMIHRGVIPIFYVQESNNFAHNVEKKVQLGLTFGKIQGYIKMGDAVVIIFGSKNHVGFKNCVEVVFASEYDTVPDTNDNDHEH